jgi:hypothetical protein
MDVPQRGRREERWEAASSSGETFLRTTPPCTSCPLPGATSWQSIPLALNSLDTTVEGLVARPVLRVIDEPDRKTAQRGVALCPKHSADR